MNTALDKGLGNDGVGVAVGHVVTDGVQKIKRVWTIAKAEFEESVRAKAEAFLKAGHSVDEALKLFSGKMIGVQKFEGNVLLNEGINELWSLVAGGAGTAFSNANSYLGVGDSSTAESASQTGLQASTNKLYKAMDASYPTYGTAQKITFRSTFGPSDANFAWNEFTAANGNSDTAKNLNRKVSTQGTKTSGQTWQLTLEITLS